METLRRLAAVLLLAGLSVGLQAAPAAAVWDVATVEASGHAGHAAAGCEDCAGDAVACAGAACDVCRGGASVVVGVRGAAASATGAVAGGHAPARDGREEGPEPGPPRGRA